MNPPFAVTAKQQQFNSLGETGKVYAVFPVPLFAVFSDEKQYHAEKTIPRAFAEILLCLAVFLALTTALNPAASTQTRIRFFFEGRSPPDTVPAGSRRSSPHTSPSVTAHRGRGSWRLTRPPGVGWRITSSSRSRRSCQGANRLALPTWQRRRRMSGDGLCCIRSVTIWQLSPVAERHICGPHEWTTTTE